MRLHSLRWWPEGGDHDVWSVRRSASSDTLRHNPKHSLRKPHTIPPHFLPAPSPEKPLFRDNPDAVLPQEVPLLAGSVDADAALRVVRLIVPQWSNVETARCKPVVGGITNGLVRLSAPEHTDVLVRVYGPNTHLVIDRERENRLFARLSEAGFAPAYLGRFQNGRVEGFLEGFRALEPHELAKGTWQKGIAQRLAQLHQFKPEQVIPRTFSSLRTWLEQARDLTFEGEAAMRHAQLKLPGALALLGTLSRLFHEQIKPHADDSFGTRAAIRPVLAHNDLLAGNIMVEESTGSVRFIDYEYSACGYAAFDIANHFCEYAGFDSDFAQHFPDRSAREAFIETYLGPESSRTDIADFDRAVCLFVLVDHLWWGSWAVIQAQHSPIDFDFLRYAELRFAGLRHHRSLFESRPG
ncbi:MAG: hypothetical protein CL927_16905 [Deltaproteobacteria bacterium]|nr:hypothetical protein [Deltaproteobacteria bacterium]HCH61440.1 hypothetical protein [Deltaproteobacteria bacterium]